MAVLLFYHTIREDENDSCRHCIQFYLKCDVHEFGGDMVKYLSFMNSTLFFHLRDSTLLWKHDIIPRSSVEGGAIVSMGYRSQVTLDNRLYYALMYIECDTFDLP